MNDEDMFTTPYDRYGVTFEDAQAAFPEAFVVWDHQCADFDAIKLHWRLYRRQKIGRGVHAIGRDRLQCRIQLQQAPDLPRHITLTWHPAARVWVRYSASGIASKPYKNPGVGQTLWSNIGRPRDERRYWCIDMSLVMSDGIGVPLTPLGTDLTKIEKIPDSGK